jgi:hypothetical protein
VFATAIYFIVRAVPGEVQQKQIVERAVEDQRKALANYSVTVIVPDKVLRVVAHQNGYEHDTLEQAIKDLDQTYNIKQLIDWHRDRHGNDVKSIIVLVEPK